MSDIDSNVPGLNQFGQGESYTKRMSPYLEGIAQWVVLGLVFFIALILRLWGTRFGLPYIYHYDEHFYVNTALKLGSGVLYNPPYSPVGLANVLALEYGFYYLFARATGLVESAQAFEALYRTDPSTFYMLGRVTSAVLGSFTVVAVFGIGRLVFDRITGLVAACFLAVSFLHVRDSHYAVPDVAMTFFLTLAVWVALLGVSRQRSWLIYVSGFIAGVAISMKWTAVPVVIPIYLSVLGLHWMQIGFGFHTLINRSVLFVTIAIIAGFALSSPQIVMKPALYFDFLSGQLEAGNLGGFEIWLVDNLSSWQFYAKQVLISSGFLLTGFFIGGICFCIWQFFRLNSLLILLAVSFPVSYYLMMSTAGHFFARYALPLTPFVALMAAVGLPFLLHRLTSPKLERFAILSVATMLLVIQPLANSIRHNVIVSREDTRTLAKHWIEQNIPAGSRIATDWETHGPPLSTSEKPKSASDSNFDYTYVGGIGLPEHSLDWYLNEGYEYLIVSSFISEIPTVDLNLQIMRDEFYNNLHREFRLVKQFSPASEEKTLPFVFDEIYGPLVSLWQRERPGPKITIYQLVP